MIDADRSAVYAAESSAFDGTDLESPMEFEALAELVGRVTAGEWWPGPPVTIRAARRDALSSSTRCGIETLHATAKIRFAAGQLTVATAAHEMAHALAGVDAGHGPLFRAAYLDVVVVITNLDSHDRRRELHARQLAAAFDAAGHTIAERRWPPPPSSSWGAIAL